MIQLATTQGPFATGGGGKAQPATTHGIGWDRTGCPITLTRGLGTVAWALPPCEQSTTEPTVNKNPGMGQSFLADVEDGKPVGQSGRR